MFEGEFGLRRMFTNSMSNGQPAGVLGCLLRNDVEWRISYMPCSRYAKMLQPINISTVPVKE